jgi:hydroxymethylbilane synthase
MTNRPSPPPTLRLGSRNSQLARWQADWVADRLRQDGYQIEPVFVSTTGDVTIGPLDQAGGAGLFTRELQRALLEGRIDLAVHSLKDLPSLCPDGLRLAAVPLRGSAQDVLVSRAGKSLDGLANDSRVGTGSARRKAQLLYYRRDLTIVGIRGNVDTRLGKLDEGQYDAIVLAEAGLVRLGCGHRISQRLPIEICLPAPGQGAIGVEIRCGDEEAARAVLAINNPKHDATTSAERSFLATIEAGCSSPVAAWCHFESEQSLRLNIAVLDTEGKRRVARSFAAPPSAANSLGQRAGCWALSHGAAELL